MKLLVGLGVLLSLAGLASAGDVRDYGALGDGKSDATKAFQTALARETIVTVPGGDYLVSEPLRLRSGQHLKLAQRATIHFRTSKPSVALLQISSAQGVTVEGGSLVGDKLLPNNSVHTGIRILGASRGVTIRNLRIGGFGSEWRHGVPFNYGDGVYVGLPTAKGEVPTDIRLQGLRCEDVDRNGIAVTAGSKLRIEDCRILRSQLCGIDLEPNRTSDPCFGIQILRNNLQNCMAGINVVKGAKQVTIVSNTIRSVLEDKDSAGIRCNSPSRELTIEKNVVIGSFTGIAAAAEAVTVRANRVVAARIGIWLREAASVEGNALEDCWQAGIRVHSKNVSVVGNQLSNCVDPDRLSKVGVDYASAIEIVDGSEGGTLVQNVIHDDRPSRREVGAIRMPKADRGGRNWKVAGNRTGSG